MFCADSSLELIGLYSEFLLLCETQKEQLSVSKTEQPGSNCVCTCKRSAFLCFSSAFLSVLWEMEKLNV